MLKTIDSRGMAPGLGRGHGPLNHTVAVFLEA